jgi:two-component system chemotaxis response regulator CheY
MTETPPTPTFNILITDDDRGIREILRELVEAQGHRPLLAADGDEAFEIVQAEPVHLALLDMHMPRMTGLETLQMIRTLNTLLPAILITADATLKLVRQAFHEKVYSVIPKPVNKNIVITTMVRALIRTYGPEKASNSPSVPTLEKPTDERDASERQDSAGASGS